MFTALGTGGVTAGLPELCTAVGCLSVGPLVRALMLAGSAAFAVAVLALLGNTDGAKAACRRERERLEAEVRAFRRFGRRVDAMEPSGASPAAKTDGGLLVDSRGRSADDLETVRTAYRETVMDVDHYETHYGESLPEHVAEEFGPGVARAVVAGEAFTPEVKRALVEGAHAAADQRADVRAATDRELESLDDAADRLESLHDRLERIRAEPRFDSFQSLADRWRRLRDLESACEDLIESRQERLGERPELREYVYDELDVRHPVLADVASLVEAIRSERAETRWMLARTV